MARSEKESHLLTCGQMARVNGITEKTLRFYQKKGLLEPEDVDGESGFRYYDILQSTKLDLITQLRTVGFSLDEILEIVEKGDLRFLRERVAAQRETLKEQRQALDLSINHATELVDSCNAYFGVPVFDQVILENRLVRYRLEFVLPNLEDFAPDYWQLSGSQQWEWVIRYVKQTLVERGWPMALFHDIGYVVDRNGMDDPNLWAYKVFVYVDESFGSCFDEAVEVPGGLYLTMYCNTGYGQDGESIDYGRFRRLLDYAHAKHLVVSGDPYCESLCRIERLFTQGIETVCAYCIPVQKSVMFPS